MLVIPKQRKVLEDPSDRAMARAIRDNQWGTLERIAEQNPLYFCWWNKDKRHPMTGELPADLVVCSYIGGVEIQQWLNTHPEWTEIGEWSDERYAAPVWITDAGREALANRELYDMEPVRGGLVYLWQAIPTEKTP